MFSVPSLPIPFSRPHNTSSELPPKVIRRPNSTSAENLRILLLLSKRSLHLALNDVLRAVGTACAGGCRLRVTGSEAVGGGGGRVGGEGSGGLGGCLRDEGVGGGGVGGHCGWW